MFVSVLRHLLTANPYQKCATIVFFKSGIQKGPTLAYTPRISDRHNFSKKSATINAPLTLSAFFPVFRTFPSCARWSPSVCQYSATTSDRKLLPEMCYNINSAYSSRNLSSFQNLPQLCAVVTECSSAFCVDFWLQTHLHQSGVLWSLLLYLFNYDYTLEEGGVEKAEGSNQQVSHRAMKGILSIMIDGNWGEKILCVLISRVLTKI